MAILFVMVGSLIAAICALLLLDKSKAYVGTIFLIIFCTILFCVVRDCCCVADPYYYPYGPSPYFGGWGWSPWGFGMPVYAAPPVVIETGSIGGGGGDDGGGGDA